VAQIARWPFVTTRTAGNTHRHRLGSGIKADRLHAAACVRWRADRAVPVPCRRRAQIFDYRAAEPPLAASLSAPHPRNPAGAVLRHRPSRTSDLPRPATSSSRPQVANDHPPGIPPGFLLSRGHGIAPAPGANSVTGVPPRACLPACCAFNCSLRAVDALDAAAADLDLLATFVEDSALAIDALVQPTRSTPNPRRWTRSSPVA
jgi:hypothetical protein